jgi:hypothetical protein
MNDSSLPDVAPLQPLPERVAERLARLPRIARIGFAALVAVATVLLITPVVDGIYMTNFFDYNTRILPALVSTGIGIAVYFVGWVVFVGYAGEGARPRRVVFWYFLTGCVVVALVLLLLLNGALDLAQGS